MIETEFVQNRKALQVRYEKHREATEKANFDYV